MSPGKPKRRSTRNQRNDLRDSDEGTNDPGQEQEQEQEEKGEESGTSLSSDDDDQQAKENDEVEQQEDHNSEEEQENADIAQEKRSPTTNNATLQQSHNQPTVPKQQEFNQPLLHTKPIPAALEASKPPADVNSKGSAEAADAYGQAIF